MRKAKGGLAGIASRDYEAGFLVVIFGVGLGVFKVLCTRGFRATF